MFSVIMAKYLHAWFWKLRRSVPEAMDMTATASLTTLRGTLYATLARL